MDHSLAAEPLAEAVTNVLQMLAVAELGAAGQRTLTASEYTAIRERLLGVRARLERRRTDRVPPGAHP